MYPLRKMKSADDRGDRAVWPTSEKRARSSSPCKDRAALRMSPGSPHLLFDSEASPSLPNSPLTHEQLVQLSRSPIAQRLHITKADYAIPIPFTLQLPPRLSKSAPGTPQKEQSSPFISPKKSPTRLLFSGSGYEPATSGSGSDSESDISKDYFKYSLGPKPPRVSQSRKKVAKFVEKSQSIPADQLSMIEESSTRTNSVKSKTLPVLPESHASTVLAINNDRPLRVLGARGPSLSRRLLRKPPPDLILESSQSSPNESAIISPPLQSGSTADSSFKGTEKLETKHDSHVTGKPIDMTILTQSINNLAISQRQQQAQLQNATSYSPIKQLPHTPAIRHELHLGNENAYQIARRTFSDESQVSSVSSFNSFGDMTSFKFRSAPDPTEENTKDTVLRQSSVITASSANSWNSVQRSLNLSLKDTLSSMSPSGQNKRDDTSKKLPDLPLEDIEDKTIEIAPLAVLRTTSDKSTLRGDDEEAVEIKPQKSELTLCEDKLLDSFGSLDYNNGEGQSFSFPNNLSNITNSTDAKIKNHRKLKHSASYSIVSPTGQIKIPDLEKETQYLQIPTQLNDALIEPIGFPSRAAREHFKIMYAGLATDSDSDSSFNSQFSKLQGSAKTRQKSPQNSNMASKQLAPSVSSTSPVRHARRRSMYDIDIQSLGVNEPSIYEHQKSKSTMDIPKLQEPSKNKFDAINSKSQGFSDRQPSSFETSNKNASTIENTNADETLQDIVIAEPPAKVNYPVDFRSALAPSKNTPSYAANFGTYYGSSRIASDTPKSHQNPISNTDSEHASSYHSSHTAGETLSTAPTDAGSVIIDLTKDEYDVCMIKRHDSTMSYKSVTEKTKDGHNVEVVLVDEEEDSSNLDRDDLLSIYSRYMGTWGPSGLLRSGSTRSYMSDSSEASAASWAASDTNFRVKSISTPVRDPPTLVASRTNLMPGPPAKNSTKITINQKQIQAPRCPKAPSFAEGTNLLVANKKNQYYAEVKARPQISIIPEKPVLRPKSNGFPSQNENNYFDYSSNPTYDFNSFIHQRNPKSIPN